MKQLLLLLACVVLTIKNASAQAALYLDPTLGIQWGWGHFSRQTPVLTYAPISGASGGLLLRYLPKGLNSKIDFSAGFMLGDASLGYRIEIPTNRIRNGVGYQASSANAYSLWHYTVRTGVKLKQFPLNPASPQAPLLKLTVVAGPQLDRMPWQNEGRLGIGGKSATNNYVDFQSEKLDSAQWGASLYGAVQLRYCRRGQERLVLSLYSILGLSDFYTSQLNYEFNGEAFTTTTRNRATAVGLSLAVPITLYPLLPRKAL